MINYLIVNEIISSAIVYAQDANCSRGFIRVVLGAPLNFIAILYSVFPICGYRFLLGCVSGIIIRKVYNKFEVCQTDLNL